MELYEIVNKFETLYCNEKFNKRICKTCNKVMKEIKNDYKKRESCKRCYILDLENRRYMNFLKL